MYLYIFEDGTMKQQLEEPSKEDFDCIGAGILDIIEVDNEIFFQFDSYGNVVEIEVSK